MNITDNTPNERFKLVVEQTGSGVIRNLEFVTETGERWPAFDPNAMAFQREDGWAVSWTGGSAGPLDSREFAEAIADALAHGIEPEPVKH